MEHQTPQFDIMYEYEITCPWCRYEFCDSWEVESGEEDLGLQDCPDCGKAFFARREIDITYVTEPCKYGTCVNCGKANTPLLCASGFLGSYEDLCIECAEKESKAMIERYRAKSKPKECLDPRGIMNGR